MKVSLDHLEEQVERFKDGTGMPIAIWRGSNASLANVPELSNIGAISRLNGTDENNRKEIKEDIQNLRRISPILLDDTVVIPTASVKKLRNNMIQVQPVSHQETGIFNEGKRSCPSTPRSLVNEKKRAKQPGHWDL